MQLNELKPTTKSKSRKRIGRGGKRGSYSGKGIKGQKSRTGVSFTPGFRGGNAPIWKLFPKKRGATKKVEIKHRTFRVKYSKPKNINLSELELNFKDGDFITPKALINSGLIADRRSGIKVLGGGELSKKLIFIGVSVSGSARTKIEKTGGTIK